MSKARLSIWGIAVLFLPIFAIYYLSTSPSYRMSNGREAKLIVSFKHTAQKAHLCDEEELLEFKKKVGERLEHMRNKKAVCGSRERMPIVIKIRLDDNDVLIKSVDPSGLWRDSATFLFEKFIVQPGKQNIEIAMRDSHKKGEEFDYHFSRELDIKPGQVMVIDFDSINSRFFIAS